jgi:FHA domain-containing protein
MIEIVVVTYNNETPARPLAARFTHPGGTIGRGEDNQFVLPDPKHHVSRREAAISSDGVDHWITNLSQANPTLLNGTELASDVAHRLRPGDKICIGLYVLQARAVDSMSTRAGAAAPPAMAGEPLHAVPSSAPARFNPRSETMMQPAVEHAPATPIRPLSLPQASAQLQARPSAVMHGTAGDTAAAAAAAAADVEEEPAPAADAQALLQAFLDGAGIPSITLSSGLTPELMTMLGALLASSIEGTVDLLGLRSLVKREVNADVTMVVVRNNNPLKFLPDGATVLTQMLRKRMPGFMGPVEAMQDAYDDLHAHQLGMTAGMQASLADLHRQLDPAVIVGAAAPGSPITRLLPVIAKARHWDRYCELHRQSAATLGNATQSMAGKAFLSAYETASERYKDEAANGR